MSFTASPVGLPRAGTIQFLTNGSASIANVSSLTFPGSTMTTDGSGSVTLTTSVNPSNIVGPVINVTGAPYNADPSGITDSTTAILAAVNAALNIGTPTTLYLPCGTYKISASLPILLDGLEGIFIQGQSASCVTILQTADADVFDVDITNYGGVLAAGSFRISGIRFQMGAAGSTTRTAVSVSTTAANGAAGTPLIIDDLVFASPSSTSYWGTEISLTEIPNDVFLSRISGDYVGGGAGTHLTVQGNSTSYTSSVFGRDFFLVGGTSGINLGNFLQGIHFDNINTINTVLAVGSSPTSGINEEIQIHNSSLMGQINFSTSGTLNSVKITNSYLYVSNSIASGSTHVNFTNIPVLTLTGNTFNGPATNASGIIGLAITGASTYSTTIGNNTFQAYLSGGTAISLASNSSNLLFVGSIFLNNSVNLSDAGTNNVFASSMENATYYPFGLAEQISVAPNPALFGTGVNGNVTISAGTTTLTRDMNYSNLTINGTGVLNTAGFRVFVANTLDISNAQTGAIINNGLPGNSASGVTNGAATSLIGSNTSSMPNANLAGAAGGISSVTTGAAGGAGQGNIVALGGSVPAGGIGGAGTNAAGTGGALGGAIQAGFASNGLPSLTPIGYWIASTKAVYGAGLSGAGGGAGGGDGTHAGGGGGGGAYGAGFIVIAARIIFRGTNSNTGIIQSKGQAGGNGGSPPAGTDCGGGGGGSGSSGGFVWILAGILTGTQIANAVDVSGGNSGNGGTGFGTGVGGGIAAGSNSGNYQLNILSPVSSTLVLSTQTGAAGTAPSGTTGGIGGLGAVSQGAL